MSRWSTLRTWLSRARGLPARAERTDRLVVRLNTIVDAGTEADQRRDQQLLELDRRLADLDVLLGRTDAAAHARFEHLAEQLRVVQASLDAQREATAVLAHAERVTLEAVLAPARDAEVARLVALHGGAGERREGLSVVVITWNHAGWLPTALASARGALDAVPSDQRGEILVLDDASTDETAEVLAAAAAADPAVRVVTSSVNLGCARARNVLVTLCRTRYAVHLDADNELFPDGVRDVHRTAADHRCAVAFGQVVASDDEGTRWDAFAHAPSAATLASGLCFDTMCVTDVGAVLDLGGYSTDPQLAGVTDDVEMLQRVLRRGGLVGYVPTVLGRYRLAPMRHSALTAHQPSSLARIRRMYRYDDPPLESTALFAAHPATGVLWATEAARRSVGEPSAALPHAPAAPVAAGPRVLVVAPGGVGNLGDDAITDAALRRVDDLLPSARVDLVTDRALPALTGRPVPWRGSLERVRAGLPEALVAAGCTALGIDPAAVAPRTTAGAADAVSLPVELGSYGLLLLVGGGNLSTPFAERQMRPRVALAAAAAAAGVPTLWTGQGVGPCTVEEAALVAAASRAAVAFGCRDPRSVDRVVQAGGRADLVGDDAMEPSAPTATRAGGHALPPAPYAVVHLRETSYVGTSGAAGIAAAVDAVAADGPGRLCGLSVNDNPPAETEVLLRVAARPHRARWSVVDAVGDVDAARRVVEGAEWVVAHSYHVVVWSLLAGTPAVLVVDSDYYRAKAEGLAELLGLDVDLAVAAEVEPEQLRARLAEVADALGRAEVGATVETVRRWWAAALPAAVRPAE